MAEDEDRNLVVLTEDLPCSIKIGRFRIEIWRSVTRHEMKTRQGSLQITENDRRWHTEQYKEHTVDPDHHLQDVINDPQFTHQRIVEENVVVEYAEDPQCLTRNRSDRSSPEKQEGQQYPAQNCAHLAVKVVR